MAKAKSHPKSKSSSVVSVNPFGNGCLPILLVLVALMAVITVIKL